MSVEIQTYIFLNAGVTGRGPQIGGLYPVQLCCIAVPRDVLLNADLERALAMETPFDFIHIPPEDFEYGKSLLRYNLKFTRETYDAFVQYLNGFPRPITLVAYDGFRFTYPILRAAISGYEGLPADLRCADLMQAMYEIEHARERQTPRDTGSMPWNSIQEKTLSYTFQDVYERALNRQYVINAGSIMRLDQFGHVPQLKCWIELVMVRYDLLNTWLAKNDSYTFFNNVHVHPNNIQD